MKSCNMWLYRALCLFVGVAFLLGCNDGSQIKVKPPGAEQIKPALEDVAKNGQLHSGLMVVRDELEKMKATDAAKAGALLKDLDELQSLKDTEKAKAKAKEMLGKL